MNSKHNGNGYAVEVMGLTKTFGEFTAVDEIDFTIRRGEIFGFLGPNGAGKTTTIRMLLGLMRPTAGSAHILGYDVTTQTDEMRRHIGYMSQKFSLYQDLTVAENLEFYGRAYGVHGAELRRRKHLAVEMAGLEGQEDELTRNLPGGWKQRLALGAAILHEPDLLFLDEPTAGVDPISRRAFWALLYQLADEGRTIFVTTHYMDEAERCQDLAFILDGQLMAQGSPEEIKRTKMRGEVLEVDCDAPREAVPLLRALGEFSEVSLYGARIHLVAPDAAAHISAVRATLTQAGIAVHSVEQILPSLEDVFISQVRARLAQAAPPEE